MVENTTLKLRSSPDADAAFNPTRLTLARRRRGMKMSELAREIHVDPRSVTNFESGIEPGEATLAAICRVLDFPNRFFYGETLEGLDPTMVSFRSMARMTASQRDVALGQGEICLNLNDWFGSRYKMPDPAVPSINLETPEGAAAIVRAEWGLGVKPVSNMIQLLESKGVRIFSLSLKATEVDAFSTWKGHTPFVMLNVQKSAEHSRFDAAHELGHLVMHQKGAPNGKEAETEANRFASAFLMPREDVLANSSPNPGIAALLQWKKRWKVSLAALNYRLHQLGMTTEYHYRHLCIRISKMGGRTSELEGIPRERSLLLEKLLTKLAEEGVTRSNIATQLSISSDELESMMFGLTMTAISGKRIGDAPEPLQRSGLTLVR